MQDAWPPEISRLEGNEASSASHYEDPKRLANPPGGRDDRFPVATGANPWDIWSGFFENPDLRSGRESGSAESRRVRGMKQVVRELGSGRIRVADVPAPQVQAGGILVRNHFSVLSPGTERMKVEDARRSLIGKALSRPDDVKRVLETASREGVGTAFRKVRGRLGEITTLGYSCAGVVEAVGEGVREFRVGDRVACAGEGYASHSERIWVPVNLAARVPDPVPLDRAAFSTLGAIALHGVRQADLRLGEWALVVGLGLVGQLTARLLRAGGVRVIAVDLDPARVRLAESSGARAFTRSDEVEGRIRELTGGLGVDGTILTAATKSRDPMELAVEASRDRARVVVVGQVPLEASRARFQEKELELRTSRSYGPGRYDPSYEEKGVDYPVGYVRWTEGRNLAAFLACLEEGSVVVDDLISHRMSIEEAERAYDLVTAGSEAMGILFEYPVRSRAEPARISVGGASLGQDAHGGLQTSRDKTDRLRLGVIGAGRFAVGTLFPMLTKLPVAFRGITSAGGTSALSAGERFGFDYIAGSPEELFRDPEVDAVVIAVRHRDHAGLAAVALAAGKSVFVEKPLALSEDQLDQVMEAAREGQARGAILMVGFNRRFAPATELLKNALAGLPGARVIHVRANAGPIPEGHWMHDPEVGGGRWVGEGCHFVDLAVHLAGSLPETVHAVGLGAPDPDAKLGDNVHATLTFPDGSLASVLYTAKGNVKAGKERVEVHVAGTTGVIEDFRRAELYGAARGRWRGRQDKGHGAELEAFVKAVREGGPSPIPLDELEASTRATVRAITGGVGPTSEVSASPGTSSVGRPD
jgi:predicted dehydrogenase/threonine dehydrogenase-like Zn-dependent dehydrogenase